MICMKWRAGRASVGLEGLCGGTLVKGGGGDQTSCLFVRPFSVLFDPTIEKI